jgi:hypothetical protein
MTLHAAAIQAALRDVAALARLADKEAREAERSGFVTIDDDNGGDGDFPSS